MKFLLTIFLIILSLNAEDVKVISYAYHLDSNHSWSVEDAYAHKENFEPLTIKNQSLGFRSDSVWVYVKVHNSSNLPSRNIMVFPYPLHDKLTVYKYKVGEIQKQYTTGDLYDFNTREINTYDFTIPYDISGGESKEFLFQLKSDSSLNIKIKFYAEEAYNTYTTKNNLILGIYYGVALLIILYNFLLFFIIKSKVYLYYALFHFSYFFLHFSLNGLIFQFIYPQTPLLNLYIVPIFFILSNALSIQFAITYLELERYTPKITKYLKLLMYSFLILLGLNFILSYGIIAITMTIMAGVSAVSLSVIAFYTWYKYRSISSTIFVIGWGFLLGGALTTELQNLGIIDMSIWSYYAAQIGAVMELSILSMYLAYSYTLMFREGEKREKVLEELTQTLEKKVELRTLQLDEKNKDLKIEIGNKNVLFQELYHRVKNNLQIISSLLSLQSMSIKDPAAKELLNEMTHRIKAISFLHEKLYQSKDLTHLSMQEYFTAIIKELQKGLHCEDVHFEIHCEDVYLDLEMSMPLGLIVNELIINSLKHAFEDNAQNKSITLSIYRPKPHTLIVEVSDNGKGAMVDVVEDGFGFQLVESMVKYQLKGSIEVINSRGMLYKMTFIEEKTIES